MSEELRTGVLTIIRPDAQMEPKIELDVLGVREEQQWCAIALEMSLRGYGPTFEDAFANLREAVKAQVTFTLEHGDYDQLFFLAEDKYIENYLEARLWESRNAFWHYVYEAGLDTSASTALVPVVEAPSRPVLRFRMPKAVEGGHFAMSWWSTGTL